MHVLLLLLLRLLLRLLVLLTRLEWQHQTQKSVSALLWHTSGCEGLGQYVLVEGDRVRQRKQRREQLECRGLPRRSGLVEGSRARARVCVSV